jgi:hypothetical protein
LAVSLHLQDLKQPQPSNSPLAALSTGTTTEGHSQLVVHVCRALK